MADVFTLRIHTRSKHFGETAAQEQHAIIEVLRNVIARIGSGHAPIPINDGARNEVATYEFSTEMLSHPENHRYPRG